MDVADKFDFLFINVFDHNAAFIGRLGQILKAADMYCAKIREIDLKLKPQQSIIYILNRDSPTCHKHSKRDSNTLHF